MTQALCRNLLLGVCASIHALQIHDYVHRFRESFAENIKVIITEHARRMVDVRTVGLYLDDQVFSDLWDRSPSVDRVPHIQLTQWAELFVILPATAGILAKAAHGIADDLLSTAIVSYRKRIVFAPAMNTAMWESPAVKRNVQTLINDGHYIVPPEPALSVLSGEEDLALTPSPETILPHLQHVCMKGLKEAYWTEATRERSLTPAQKKLQAMALKVKLSANDEG